MMDAYNNLTMRPDAVECIYRLRQAGFTVWALTAADRDGVAGLFTKAGVEMPKENLLSCDLYGVGKPDPLAYEPLLKQLAQYGTKPWFAAAHCWDVSAAQRKGWVLPALNFPLFLLFFFFVTDNLIIGSVVLTLWY